MARLNAAASFVPRRAAECSSDSGLDGAGACFCAASGDRGLIAAEWDQAAPCVPRFRRQHASGGHGPVMPGGAAPNDNLLIAGSQRDPLADRRCHGTPPGSPGIVRYRRGPEQQESQSHVRAGTIRTIVLLVTVRPIREGGKRCGSPGKTPAPASPGGQGRMSRGSQLPAHFASGPLAPANSEGATWRPGRYPQTSSATRTRLDRRYLAHHRVDCEGRHHLDDRLYCRRGRRHPGFARG